MYFRLYHAGLVEPRLALVAAPLRFSPSYLQRLYKDDKTKCVFPTAYMHANIIITGQDTRRFELAIQGDGAESAIRVATKLDYKTMLGHSSGRQ